VLFKLYGITKVMIFRKNCRFQIGVSVLFTLNKHYLFLPPELVLIITLPADLNIQMRLLKKLTYVILQRN
jgi:hypothetical protein